ncbi:MAG: hypothetical protein CM15mP51_23820 [Porticoccaceae bacterium]|nr:MAG: hypothetical protein CM15mP51_23820 [Porticoccaceae bacterium]
MDSFIDSSIKICGEIELRIHHHFMIGDNTKVPNITRFIPCTIIGSMQEMVEFKLPNIGECVASNGDAAKELKENGTLQLLPDMCSDYIIAKIVGKKFRIGQTIQQDSW